MKEKFSIDKHTWEMNLDIQSKFKEHVKMLADNRVKYIEDYIKFWLAINVENLESITPEVFARDFHLIEKRFADCIAWQILPHNQMIIDKEEYERLKRLDENVKNMLERIKSGNCGFDDWTYTEVIELLEGLDK